MRRVVCVVMLLSGSILGCSKDDSSTTVADSGAGAGAPADAGAPMGAGAPMAAGAPMGAGSPEGAGAPGGMGMGMVAPGADAAAPMTPSPETYGAAAGAAAPPGAGPMPPGYPGAGYPGAGDPGAAAAGPMPPGYPGAGYPGAGDPAAAGPMPPGGYGPPGAAGAPGPMPPGGYNYGAPGAAGAPGPMPPSEYNYSAPGAAGAPGPMPPGGYPAAAGAEPVDGGLGTTPPGATPAGYPMPGAGAAGYPMPGAAYPGGAMPPGAGVPGAGVPGAGVPGAGVPGAGPPGAGAPGYGSPGEAGGGQPAVPQGLEGKAQLAFRGGKEAEAMRLMLAHALVSDRGGREVLGTMKWVPGLRRPALAVRWGVGAHISAQRELQSNLMPIGTTQQGLGRRGRQDGPEGTGAPGAPGGYAAPGGFPGAPGEGGGGSGSSAIASFAGDLGDKLIDGYRARLERDGFGRVLRDLAGGGQNSGNPGIGGPGAVPGGYPGPGAIPGAPGAAPGGYPAPGGEGFAGPGGAGGAGQQAQLAPGLTYLGMGTSKELLAKAREAEIDVLILFEVAVRRGRAGPIANDTKIEIYDVAKGNEVHSSKNLNNVQVQLAREQDKDDGVEKEINNLFAFVDKTYVMVDLPAALTPERAVARVSSLAAAKADSPLATLAEMKLYHVLGLVRDEDLVHGYDGIVGEGNGAKLAAGSDEERQQVLERWLPRGE